MIHSSEIKSHSIRNIARDSAYDFYIKYYDFLSHGLTIKVLYTFILKLNINLISLKESELNIYDGRLEKKIIDGEVIENIYIKSSQSVKLKIFTILHELGHWYYNNFLQSTLFLDKKEQEYFASSFAGQLAIPFDIRPQLLKNLFTSNNVLDIVDTMNSKIWHINSSVSNFLKILFYDLLTSKYFIENEKFETIWLTVSLSKSKSSNLIAKNRVQSFLYNHSNYFIPQYIKICDLVTISDEELNILPKEIIKKDSKIRILNRNPNYTFNSNNEIKYHKKLQNCKIEILRLRNSLANNSPNFIFLIKLI